MTDPYTYGMDDVIKAARSVMDSPVTVESEQAADQVYAHALDVGGLPVGYIVRAILRCNQLDSFRMVACDWHDKLEIRRENVQLAARRRLSRHLRAAHPYLGDAGVASLVRATSFNFRDVGR